MYVLITPLFTVYHSPGPNISQYILLFGDIYYLLLIDREREVPDMVRGVCRVATAVTG